MGRTKRGKSCFYSIYSLFFESILGRSLVASVTMRKEPL